MSAKGGKWLNPFCTDIDTFSSHLSQTCAKQAGTFRDDPLQFPFFFGMFCIRCYR